MKTFPRGYAYDPEYGHPDPQPAPIPRSGFDWPMLAVMGACVITAFLAVVGFCTVIAWGLMAL